MAIHPDHPGLAVEVVVDGTTLKEYADDEDVQPQGTATKYIEAVAGTNYSVRVQIPPALFAKYSIVTHLRIDGVKVRGGIHFRSNYANKGSVSLIDCSHAVVDGKAMSQLFRFGTISTCETMALTGSDLKNHLACTGNISVRFYRANNIRRKSLKRRKKQLPQLQEYEEIPEQLLKGSTVSLNTSLDPLTPRTDSGSFTSNKVDGRDHPFAVINLKYRSLAALKSLGLIPRTPSPQPLEDRPEEELTPSEMLELLKRYKAKDTTARALKRENPGEEAGGNDHEDDEDDVEVIEVRSAKRICLPNWRAEVIILD